MKTFETFIESEAFFPVLILLLVLLVGVFMWIILSNKKEAQKRREKKKVNIDENAEIKIVSDGNDDVRIRKVKKEKLEEEPERTEIAIVEEVAGTNDFLNIKREEPKETIYNIDLPNFNEARFTRDDEEQEEVIDYKNIDYGDLSVPPVPDIFKDEINGQATAQIEEHKQENVEVEEEIDETPELSYESNAFNVPPISDDREIHEDIKYEAPKEYMGEKTEVFDFPDFDQDDIFSSGDIETEIITAAEDYIKDIMSKK